MEEQFDIRNNKSTEKELENALRPLSLTDFKGQNKIVENLKIFVQAARMRTESLDHVLLHGPPGLGKTTLSNIIANELNVGFKITSGPVLDKPGDLAGLLTSLEPNDVLFIRILGFYCLECLKSIHVWHSDIHYYKIRLNLFVLFYSLNSVCCLIKICKSFLS